MNGCHDAQNYTLMNANLHSLLNEHTATQRTMQQKQCDAKKKKIRGEGGGSK